LRFKKQWVHNYSFREKREKGGKTRPRTVWGQNAKAEGHKTHYLPQNQQTGQTYIINVNKTHLKTGKSLKKLTKCTMGKKKTNKWGRQGGV